MWEEFLAGGEVGAVHVIGDKGSLHGPLGCEVLKHLTYLFGRKFKALPPSEKRKSPYLVKRKVLSLLKKIVSGSVRQCDGLHCSYQTFMMTVMVL